jgi:protein TonB
MPTFLGFAVSMALHGGALLYLAWMTSTRPVAPTLAGGPGSGSIEIELGSWLTDEPVLPPPVAARNSNASTATAPAPPPPPDPAPAVETPAEAMVQEATRALARDDEAATAQAPPEEPSTAPRVPAEEEPPPRATLPAAETPLEPARGPGIEGPHLPGEEAVRPVYPLSCRRLRNQGLVVVRATVGTDGRVTHVEVTRSAGCTELDGAAMDAVRRAHFRPAREWGRPVACVIEQPIPFKLRDRVHPSS